MAWFMGVATGSAAGQTAKHATAKVTVITVTAGKPTELGFKLSKLSNLPAGTFTFKVTNAGAVGHIFKICTTPTMSSKANSCVGKATKLLNKGQSQSLTVVLTKSGKYEFLCPVPGHAGAGMKGLLGIGVAVTPTASVAGSTSSSSPGSSNTSPSSTGSSSGTTAATASTCANPQTTTFSVSMFDFGFSGVPASAPCGTLIVTEVNNGQADHNIDINGQAGGIISPGQSQTFKVNLTPGSYSYICDVPGHDGLGMHGQITIAS
jgi:nitrite reductase (NO-forming)